jgi:hypothetical protein
MDVKLEQLKFADLPVSVREDVKRWRRILKIVAHTNPSRKSVELIARNRRVSISTAYKKLRAYEDFGWRGIVNRAKLAQNASAVPVPFQIFLRGLWLLNRRSYRHTHNQVMAMWKGRAMLPGYARTPEAAFTNGCPNGWTYENFIYLIKQLERKYPDIDGKILKGLLNTQVARRQF